VNIILIVTCVLVAFIVGLIAGGALSMSVIEDQHNLLAHLLDNPVDDDVRAVVRNYLYQEPLEQIDWRPLSDDEQVILANIEEGQ